jgi:Tfp pilus assembly protein FimT
VLVLMLAALLLAAVAPNLGGFNRGRRVENTADQFLSAARWARSEAITQAMPHRLELDSGIPGWRVMRFDGTAWDLVPGEFGREQALLPGLMIELERPDGVLDAIEFYPNGRTTPATVRISADWGGEVILQSSGAAEALRRVRP